mgnify:FL=1
MIYYKVTLQGGGKQTFIQTTKGKKPVRTLIAGELYTQKEVQRFNIPLRYVVVENHRPKDTVMRWGVRYGKRLPSTYLFRVAKIQNQTTLLKEEQI